MRNKFLFLSFLLLTSIFAISFVSADAATEVSGFLGSVTKVVDAILTGLKPLAAILFGSENVGGVGEADSSSFILANIAIFIIVFILVYLVLDSVAFFHTHSWSVKVLSVIVSFLAVRFLSNGMINAIIYPYKALGIILVAAIPFLLLFVIIELKIKSTSPFARKISWIFAAVVFLMLYVVRAFYDSSAAPELSNYLLIYPVTAAICLIMILLDGSIQKWVNTGTIQRAQAHSNAAILKHLTRDLKQAEKDFKDGVFGRGPAAVAAYKAEIARIKAEIAALS